MFKCKCLMFLFACVSQTDSGIQFPTYPKGNERSLPSGKVARVWRWSFLHTVYVSLCVRFYLHAHYMPFWLMNWSRNNTCHYLPPWYRLMLAATVSTSTPGACNQDPLPEETSPYRHGGRGKKRKTVMNQSRRPSHLNSHSSTPYLLITEMCVLFA